MKKDKEWLKEEVWKQDTVMSKGYIYTDDLMSIINELDEPEKPVIPQFVADWIEENKDRKLTLYGAIHECPREVDYWLVDGDSSNQETFAKAWLDGYEVVKEQKYHVVNKENYFMLRKYDGLVDILHVSPSMSRDEYGKDTRFMLTEKEIKDYDERFWAFAEEVME